MSGVKRYRTCVQHAKGLLSRHIRQSQHSRWLQQGALGSCSLCAQSLRAVHGLCIGVGGTEGEGLASNRRQLKKS